MGGPCAAVDSHSRSGRQIENPLGSLTSRLLILPAVRKVRATAIPPARIPPNAKSGPGWNCMALPAGTTPPLHPSHTTRRPTKFFFALANAIVWSESTGPVTIVAPSSAATAFRVDLPSHGNKSGVEI